MIVVTEKYTGSWVVDDENALAWDLGAKLRVPHELILNCLNNGGIKTFNRRYSKLEELPEKIKSKIKGGK